MNGQGQLLLSIDDRIRKLREEKMDLKEKLKKEGMELREKKKKELKEKMKKEKIEIQKTKIQNKIQYGNSANVLQRISTRFDLKIDEINGKREETGFDKLSKPKITELIVRHKSFSVIEKDLIQFNPNLEEENNDEANNNE